MKYISIISIFLCILVSAYFYLSYIRDKNAKNTNIEVSIYKKIINYLGDIKGGYFSKERISKSLKSYGNPYNITPDGYIIFKVIPTVLFFILSFAEGWYIAGIILAIASFFILDLCFFIKNYEDMNKITFELKNIYDAIIMQTAAGLYIGDILNQCYLIVSNKRIKRSLAELTAEISIYSNMESALDNFTEKFRSDDINNFAVAIKQSLKTGKSLEQLEDVSSQIDDLNLVAVQEITSKIPDKMSLIGLYYFGGIMATIAIFTFPSLTQFSTGLLK
ncbi:hypothetical protein [Clostridium akagii]|uniref:hypothetical protein n=1 Tax=Clostridium akagii TaxID=91623 RepID=UPI00047CF41F|nr:hypothetical protein [Clostridium akagii]